MPPSALMPSVRTPQPAPVHERRLRLRLMLVALGATGWALAVAVRLLHLQVLEHALFERQAARQSERTLTIDPRRGPILDRNGHALAVSVDAESVYAVPQDVGDTEGTVAALARALHLDAKERRDLGTQLRRNKAFVWVRRKLDPATARSVRALQLDGIGFLAESRRYYPKRELASQVLGYVGLDNAGMSGIEYSFDSEMRGRAAKVVVRTDARRRPMGHAERPSTEGRTVVLTIDESIQHIAERELQRSVLETHSVSGIAIVMEPSTGEVLALASEPAFNPNSFSDYPSSRWVNRAVADAYEPGSIFKVITAAAALQEKVVTPDEVLDCGNGSIQIAGITINDHAIFSKLSFRDVIAHSSDVGVMRVAQRLGRQQFDHYLRDFGFGAATGVELPGEAKGTLRPLARWSELSLPTLSFGQEIAVTGLQMITAVSAVANGGYLMKPHVLSALEEPDGRVAKRTPPEAVRRVIEPQTVDTLMEILREVVRNGTGRHAAIPGYIVAGKTGTAQKAKASGGYSMEDHVASFVGIVPASRPAIVVLVSLDSPKGARNEGGDVAAPAFARIAEPVLQYLGVPPDDAERVLRLPVAGPTTPLKASYAPGVEALPPLPERRSGAPARMPDLHGRSAREAAVWAARFGLIVELRGSGSVQAQAPEPGTTLEDGMTCVLTLGRTLPEAPASAQPAKAPEARS
jgi:cell division protein FtsI (penicillin-binding protein 3)